MRAIRKPLITVQILTLACVLFPSSRISFGQTSEWARQRSGTLSWLHSVFFLNENAGWAVGSRGTLLATEDGGKNWQPKSRPTEDVIRDIYFTDEVTGWLVCERNIYDLKAKDEPRAYLMTTKDGGQHWSRVNVRGVDIDARLTRALFGSGGRAWTFGEGGSVYTTRDGGTSWTKLSEL